MRFVHSFHSKPDDPSHLIASCNYDGQAVGAVAQNGDVMGCRFHPEKSAGIGEQILKNFINI